MLYFTFIFQICGEIIFCGWSPTIIVSRIIISRFNRPQKGEANTCAPVLHPELEACQVSSQVLLKPKNTMFLAFLFKICQCMAELYIHCNLVCIFFTCIFFKLYFTHALIPKKRNSFFKINNFIEFYKI